jgi:hypothetical protein
MAIIKEKTKRRMQERPRTGRRRTGEWHVGALDHPYWWNGYDVQHNVNGAPCNSVGSWNTEWPRALTLSFAHVTASHVWGRRRDSANNIGVDAINRNCAHAGKIHSASTLPTTQRAGMNYQGCNFSWWVWLSSIKKFKIYNTTDADTDRQTPARVCNGNKCGWN